MRIASHLFRHSHVAELRRHRATGARRDHEQGRKDGGDLASERDRDDGAHDALGSELAQAIRRLERQNHAAEGARQRDDEDRLNADEPIAFNSCITR